jgi:hypothetical protein
VVAQEGEDGVGPGGREDADPAGSHDSGGGGEATGGDEVGGGVQIGGSREGRRGVVVTEEGVGLEGTMSFLDSWVTHRGPCLDKKNYPKIHPIKYLNTYIKN